MGTIQNLFLKLFIDSSVDHIQNQCKPRQLINPVKNYNRFDILEDEISFLEDVDNVIPEMKCEPANLTKQTVSNKTNAKDIISPSEFTDFEQKENNVEERFGLNVMFTSFLLTQIRKNNVEESWVRCSKCWINHTPYPKFCRWTRSSLKKKNYAFTNHISDELRQKIEQQIERIERNETRTTTVV